MFNMVAISVTFSLGFPMALPSATSTALIFNHPSKDTTSTPRAFNTVAIDPGSALVSSDMAPDAMSATMAPAVETLSEHRH